MIIERRYKFPQLQFSRKKGVLGRERERGSSEEGRFRPAQAAPLSKLKTWLDSANYRNIMSASSLFPRDIDVWRNSTRERRREGGGVLNGWRHPATRKSADSWISGSSHLHLLLLNSSPPRRRTTKHSTTRSRRGEFFVVILEMIDFVKVREKFRRELVGRKWKDG